jgi:septum formation protein
MAREKACAAGGAHDEIVLAADKIVIIDGQILGKPRDAADAMRMLQALSGRSHEVVTAICVKYEDNIVVDSDSTRVWFAPLDDAEIRWYVASGEPMDKAGAYAIQGLAARFIGRIEGSYSNVVGLPVALVVRRLRESGWAD